MPTIGSSEHCLESVLNNDEDKQILYHAGSDDSQNDVSPLLADDMSVLDEPVNPSSLFANFSYCPTNRYFRNLRSNMPSNILGNCGYVALSMLMSYYDTVYNDAIINENYESHSNVSYDVYAADAINYESPGLWDNVNGSSDYKNDDELIAEALLINSNLNSTEYKESLEANYVSELSKYIDSNSFLGYLFELAFDANILKTHDNNSYNPIMNNIGSNYLNGVGVSYDIMMALTTEYIQKNQFLQSSLVQIDSYQVKKMPNDVIKEGELTKVRNGIIEHLQRGIPVIVGGHPFNGDGGHSCIAYGYNAETDTIYCNGGWGGFRNMVDSDEILEVIEDYISLDFGPGAMHHCTHNYDFCPCGQQFVKHTISASDYGFEQQYFYDNRSKDHGVDGLTFSTERLRCGYIEQERVNLSPIRYNAGTSYLLFSFDNPSIQTIALDISFWSMLEFLDQSNGSALIQYSFDGVQWVTIFDLLNNFELSTNRTMHDTLSFSFSDFMHYFRIISTSTKTSSNETRNKGRISIDNVYVYTID